MDTRRFCFVSLWILAGLLSLTAGNKKICNQKLLCSDCITVHKDCAWCKQEEFVGTRCSTLDDLKNELKCDDAEIIFPKNNVTAPQNSSLQDGSQESDPVQLSPQHVSLTLRPGKASLLDVKYRVAENLPIDLYFVLDYTITMKNRIQDLATLTEELIDGLKEKFSKNIFIGFGSFVDKPVQPFSITTKQHAENPCVLQKTQCERTYGYIHRKKLNNNIEQFIKTIKSAQTSANFDPMEGGLDAVLQAAVCPEIVGWRNHSRRVLVYISDSGFHFAGDGKLAGIDRPHDGLCHMAPYNKSTEQFIYTHAGIFDYPSYGHLKKVLADNKINSFFVVDELDKKMYAGLTDMIGSQSATETMDTEGAGHIVNRIKKFFDDLSKKVEITAENLPDEIDVIAETDCNNQRVKNTFILKERSIECDNLEIGKEVSINVSIVANECPKDGSRKKQFRLVPSGLQEALLVEVEFICDCECKTSEELDEKCSNGNGTYTCGVCKCKSGRSGELCQCDNDDDSSDLSIQEVNCRKNNDSESLCEGRGTCKCGQCICPKDYEGKFCECDNTKCIGPFSSEHCTSKEQGVCECGTCNCKNSFHGEFCECPSDVHCISPNNKKKCSGNGECACGKCNCNLGYNGTYCEDCPLCDNCLKCGNEAQKRCITCLDENMDVPNASYTKCSEQCSILNVTIVTKFQRGVQPCGTFNKEKCQISYVIMCDNDTVHLHQAKTNLCVSPPDPLLIALPVLGGIIGVGLLLLVIWKILTTFYDKIEYARFEHEIQDPKWSKTDNPIYKTPVTSNQNPVYKGNVNY